MNRPTAAALALAIGLGAALVAVPSEAQAAPARYRSCAALAEVHPGGVAKSRAADARTPGVQVVSRALYRANRSLDRDRDGVACERDYWPAVQAPKAPAGAALVCQPFPVPYVPPAPGQCYSSQVTA
jgi:Excalibur calcium-binding domain